MAPHPPITLPSLHNKSSLTSLTYTSSYKPISQILGLSNAGRMTPPEQINANSHTEYASSFPSTFHLFSQINAATATSDPPTHSVEHSVDHSVHSIDTPSHASHASHASHTSNNTNNDKENANKHNRKKRRHKHKRARTKVRLQQSSIPPPPPTIGYSQSVPPKRDRSRSFTNSSFESLPCGMQPIPEHGSENANVAQAARPRFTSTGTARSDAVLIEVDEMDDLEGERMAIRNARKKMKRISTSHSLRLDALQQSEISNNSTAVSKTKETNRAKIRSKNMESDSFWEHNRRIPFIGLAMATSTFLILVFVYFTNLFRFLFGGLVPCLVGLIMIVPIYYFFRKYDSTLQYKSVVIEDHIAEEKRLTQVNDALAIQNKELSDKSEDLSTRLLIKLDIISEQNSKIRDLNEVIFVAEQNRIKRRQSESVSRSYSNSRDHSQTQAANKTNADRLHKRSSSSKVMKKKFKKCTLLRGLLRGEMESQLEVCDIDDLVHMLPIMTSCITLMPFGMSQTRRKFQRILESKISNNPYLKMQFYLFLVSFLGCLDVQRLFRKHKIMGAVSKTCSFYKYSWDDMMEKCGYLNTGDRVYSVCCLSDDDDTVRGDDDMDSASDNDRRSMIYLSSPTGGSGGSDIDTHSALGADIYGQCSHAISGEETSAVVIECEETVVFNERDPVQLFRMPIDRNAAVGFTVMVANNLRSRFFDPINGNSCVEQLKVRKIFNSNARPYLIDCFCLDEEEQMYLSSSYILKRGDDLRKDGAVLKMFEFTNLIWSSNELRYKEAGVSSLIYKCIPIGPDVGIIEVIPNCIELNKVMSLRHKLRTKENRHLYNKLVASAAGAFIAAFVMGIRDRHDDNILINQAHDGYNLFHIDFGYMFGDRAPVDTAKLAITSGLKNVFDIYDDGW
eukprot:114492_1